MTTIGINEFEAFVSVVRDGSFTRAADRLGTRKAHLSRVVNRLETRLGARLLQRTTRSLSLTEVGREVYERATSILGAVDETIRVVQRTQDVPRGILRVTCGAEFGLLVVNDWLSSYLARYPEVSIEADFSNRVADVVHEGFDVAVRVGMLDDSGLSARKLGELAYGLFAAPSYLRGTRRLRSPNELREHSLVLSTQTRKGRGKWELRKETERFVLEATPRLLVNSHLAVRDACLAGVGIGLLPLFQAQPFIENGSLEAVLPAWGREPAPVHVVYASRVFLTPKVRAFVDEAQRCFAGLVQRERARPGPSRRRS